jgi:NAD(P)-dependent dehydrogenase (short-subunit alcohol dehydrogenase family)
MVSFYNKNVLIIGGGKGFARTMAMQLAKERANIGVIHDRKDELQEIERDLGNMRIRNYGFLCNFGVRSDIEYAAKLFRRQFEKADIIILGAEPDEHLSLPDLDLDKIDHYIAKQLSGSLYLTKIFHPDIIEKKDGGFIVMDYARRGSGEILDNITEAGLDVLSAYLNAFFKSGGFKNISVTRVLLTKNLPYTLQHAQKILKAFLRRKSFVKL